MVKPKVFLSSMTFTLACSCLSAWLLVGGQHQHQHQRQISRIALRGTCLFSAGHDGQVNQYAVAYATAEPRQPGRPVEKGEGKDRPSFQESRVASVLSSAPVDLAIVTTYATAPVSAVSELWVGGYGDCDDAVQGNRSAGLEPVVGGSSGMVRLAVAGRSGSSRMSVWDITEARQLLEVTRLFRQPCCGACLFAGHLVVCKQDS